jgi:nucleotide-binding universal stress UspA family protein
MNLRDIVVFLDVGTASDERLRLATSIARQHEACLSAVFLQDDRVAEFPSGLSVPRLGLMAGAPIPVATEISRSVMFAETAERRFRECLRSYRGEGDWYSLVRASTTELVALARAVDLIVIGQVNPNARPAPAMRPEEIVVACGRPVLMVPYIGSYAQVGRRVLVAWDGSREAVRALNDALPVIGGATAVTVLTVRGHAKDPDRDQVPTNRIIRHLTRHGVIVRAEEILRGSNAISDILLSRAADYSVDLIVAGANYHSRLRDALIGGVSRGLFQHMTVPVLMSH